MKFVFFRPTTKTYLIKAILITFTIVYYELCFSQTRDSSMVNNGDFMITKISPADDMRKCGNIKGAIEAYKDMYQTQGTSFTDYYNYACALSLDKQIDSAFKYLKIATNLNPSPTSLCDPDFLNLRKDKQWIPFENNLITSIQEASEHPIKDIEYAKILWLLGAKDQAYTDCISLSEDKIGRNSTVVLALFDLKSILQNQNEDVLEQMISQKGWPLISEVGDYAANSAFLVIQHSDIYKQKEYLPVILDACKKGECRWQSYALLYDRVQIIEGKPQKYGSQVRYNSETKQYEVCPLLDEFQVDQWRKEVGLNPLSEYLSNWDIEFEPKKK